LVPPHELRLSLIDTAGHTVRGWRITSQAELGGIAAKAAMIHDDLVVMLSIDEQTKNKAFWEYLVLRLPPTGGTNVRLAIAPESRVMWGSEYLTGLQVGPDGQLYQLRSDRPTGISIARYYLTPKTTPPATTTPGGAVPPSSMAPPATSTPAPTVTEPATPPVQAQPSGRSVLPWVMAVAVPALLAAGVGGWLWYRRRHPAGSRRHGRPRPAD
jgi:hypothetical protein